MKNMRDVGVFRRLIAPLFIAIGVLGMLSACSSDKPKPMELSAAPTAFSVREAWRLSVGTVRFPLQTAVVGNTVVVGGGDGVILAADATSGRELWRASLSQGLNAGVGFDGSLAAVVTQGNELVGIKDGAVTWRAPLGLQSFTAPLVAGGRVFAVTADRTVHAFDGNTGLKIWSQARTSEPLTLKGSSSLIAVGDTVIAGVSGRLVGFNPDTGTIRFEAPISISRGTNDVERLVDLVGRVSRIGDSVCARSFQSSVGCVNVGRGVTLWTKASVGADGVHGDERQIYGVDADSRVVAWARSDGERRWTNDKLLHRGVGAPLAIGRSVAVGDAQGFIHFLSREDGSLIGRAGTDGSAVVAAPVLAGNTLVAVTRNGSVFGWQPN